MENKYLTKFEVELYYEEEHSCEQGFIFATSYADAAEQLENYYGLELMTIKNLSLIGDENIPLLLSSETYNTVLKEVE